MLNNNLEERIEANERRIKELTIALEGWEAEYNALLQEMDIDIEEVRERLSNPDNFDPQTWEVLQEHKKALEEKLASISDVPSLKEIKKKYDDLRDRKPHWIPMR